MFLYDFLHKVKGFLPANFENFKIATFLHEIGGRENINHWELNDCQRKKYLFSLKFLHGFVANGPKWA